MFFLRAEGFFSSLDVLYGGIEIGNIAIFDQKYFISAVNFFQFLVIKTLESDRSA
jgi:hypothetical protein